ncbi:hypothetical protein [Peredibacter starrii]|uniref:YuzL family protein n=1 Tax=Peredibacter starrii TaxID=28202 RepID=A0AAX4HUD5_9BACT|nr:hypothetical protein [Peredibacter starrii]WPU66693.1 hypothetical protein SOO65_08035 [Peredibacter starrii]
MALLLHPSFWANKTRMVFMDNAKDQKTKPTNDSNKSVGTGSGQSGGAGGVKRSSGPQDTPDTK